MNIQPTLVYVEDDQNSILVMKMIVQKIMNLKHLYVFEDSNDFIFRLEQMNLLPDIFLLDIQMKPFDGFQLLEILRNNDKYKDSKVIAVTASVMSEQVERLKISSFNGAIAKPLDLSAFPKLIARINAGEEVWHIV